MNVFFFFFINLKFRKNEIFLNIFFIFIFIVFGKKDEFLGSSFYKSPCFLGLIFENRQNI